MRRSVTARRGAEGRLLPRGCAPGTGDLHVTAADRGPLADGGGRAPSDLQLCAARVRDQRLHPVTRRALRPGREHRRQRGRGAVPRRQRPGSTGSAQLQHRRLVADTTSTSTPRWATTNSDRLRQPLQAHERHDALAMTILGESLLSSLDRRERVDGRDRRLDGRHPHRSTCASGAHARRAQAAPPARPGPPARPVPPTTPTRSTARRRTPSADPEEAAGDRDRAAGADARHDQRRRQADHQRARHDHLLVVYSGRVVSSTNVPGEQRHALARRRPAACGELDCDADRSRPGRHASYCTAPLQRSLALPPRRHHKRSGWSARTIERGARANLDPDRLLANLRGYQRPAGFSVIGLKERRRRQALEFETGATDRLLPDGGDGVRGKRARR